MLSARSALFTLLALTVPAATMACTAPSDEGSGAGDVEDVTSGVTTKALVKGNTAFATDLYGELTSGTDNVFFSPYSISAAIGMTYAGAHGGTATAMKGALHLPVGNVHVAFRGLADELAKRSKTVGHGGGDPFQLAVANSLWGEKSQHFDPAFVKLLKDDYAAGLLPADFLHSADVERKRINGWVAGETNDKIKDLLPPNILQNDTKLVLVNAIYFKAGWSKPFRATATEKEAFTTLAGQSVQSDMMYARETVKYASTATYDAVAVPYSGGEVELVAIAPKAGKFSTFESSFDATALGEIYGGLAPQEVALHFPKFKIAGSSVKLKDALTKLGMGVAFTNDADLSGITGHSDTKISDVIHKAFINLDETGTEAAAATAVVVIAKSAMPHAVKDVRFDRPFIFAIRDVPTGAILFLGRVANPKN